MNSDRRCDPRHEIPLVAFIQVVKSDVHEPGLTLSARVEEISMSGLRITPAVQIDDGLVEMFVALPSGDRLFLAAEIRWSATDGETFEAGLELIERDDTDILTWRFFASELNKTRLEVVC